MYYLGKIVGCLLSPIGVALIGFMAWVVLGPIGDKSSHVCIWRRARKLVGIIIVCWLWFWSSPIVGRFVGFGLEREFLVAGSIPDVHLYPNADAILLLGGSMGFNTNICDTAEMWASADRVWHAARLFKAGKAKVIVVTGEGVEASTWQLLCDFGVPRDVVVFDERPRNTQEEACVIAEYPYKRVLLVTSAWHMKRAVLIMEKFAHGIEIIPSPTDFENTIVSSRDIVFTDFIPSAGALSANSIAFHEWLGYCAYKILH